ncbi:MAG: tRNA epoxyqueuosine(34) reductase QueG [Myxococcales bacterium]|nr:tRNA epoxyqueuosine(34) reductase QueG [Polyangiaceae bacterium]MDW8251056.1 tRNA epoxyqueuosine(34) reductase QueG [Myxococcales bacterium]
MYRSSLEQTIRERARALGFDALGIARADLPLDTEFARYEAFLDAGMHGSMTWLAENREVRRRLDTADILKGARSVLCLAIRYARPEKEVVPGSVASLIARYARGQDYHNAIRKRLRKLAAFVRTLGEGVEARPMIDTAPVLERAWAARSGLGFLGKNGLIIVPGQGSYLLLGEVVTTLELPPGEPMTERCGSCTRCLDACPTGAFPAPFVLDTRRCISALTIEHRGPLDEPIHSSLGEHLFGCDVCQEVCPFNRTRPPPPERTRLFAPLSRWQQMTPEQLLEATDLDALRKGSPLYRCPPAELLRNALSVLVHRNARNALPAIQRLAREHPEPWLRAHARQAAEALGGALPSAEIV